MALGVIRPRADNAAEQRLGLREVALLGGDDPQVAAGRDVPGVGIEHLPIKPLGLGDRAAPVRALGVSEDLLERDHEDVQPSRAYGSRQRRYWISKLVAPSISLT